MDNTIEATSKTNINAQLPEFTREEIFVTLSQSMDWGMRTLGVPDIWKKTKGKGITVCILDTGCPSSKNKDGTIKVHTELDHAVLVEKCKSFVSDEDIHDGNGHGTACAGIIAEKYNEKGFVGYAPEAKIITYKVLGSSGAGSLNGITNALKDALQLHPDIVSMSLGSTNGTMSLHSAIKALEKAGIPVICAAGNGGKAEGCNYPAKYDETFAIGAYDKSGKIANFSAIGPELDFAFPGVDINTTWLSNGHTKISGTSFACPSCAGLVALLLAADPSLKEQMIKDKSTDALYEKLKAVAKNPSKDGERTSDWGWGVVDIDMLFGSAEAKEKARKGFFSKLWRKVKKFFKKIFK